MLSGIKIFTNDAVWRHILTELGATIVGDSLVCDVNLDELNLGPQVPVAELKSMIFGAIDNTKIIDSIFGEHVALSSIQTKIVTLLYKSGGMSSKKLKIALGYSPDATTHNVETAIYNLRKLYGREFIKNTKGNFKLGWV